MAKKSPAARTIRKSAAQIPKASASDLERLRAAMKGDIDTGEIPERQKFQPIARDAGGNLPRRKSVIRDAIERAMRHLDLNAYRLWQRGRLHYPQLSQSAVHEFLKGRRQLELPSIEALLAAVNLHVTPKKPHRSKTS